MSPTSLWHLRLYDILYDILDCLVVGIRGIGELDHVAMVPAQGNLLLIVSANDS